MIVLLCILLISCTPVITPIPIPVPNECVLSGVWSGYVITTDNFLFTTNVGMKGINVPVLLILHESKRL